MLLQEKAKQAQALLKETGLDCWMTFVKETSIHPDPGVELVVGTDVTWLSAFLFGKDGQRLAIVGRYDVSNIRGLGVFDEVVGYDETIRPLLQGALKKLDPQQIGLNYSTDDSTADGLTHGLWLVLSSLVWDTPYANRLTSAAPLLAKLRARKSPAEVERIRGAINSTEAVVALVGEQLRPGVSETEVADFVHEQFRARNLVSAWPWESCPIVNIGPSSEAGHGKPQAHIRLEPGQLVHIDLGVKQDGYCSDLQRMWYVRRPGEPKPAERVRRAFTTVRSAIEAGAAALKPGVRGFEVDAAARKVIADAGYPDFKHGFGHGLGRAVHDGGTMLGPKWEKYGKTPEGIIEPGNVFTLELGVPTDAGYIGLEEDVLVTEKGCEFLSSFQGELILI
ncbi:MAG TPA: Xaa-Pro peptidase family protein [Gemmataceae bacterium]|jgi:Xaa-Pro aminopeptidase|nr:Xaa-Pro peptidase family protein [Gemmataceae bacterium]